MSNLREMRLSELLTAQADVYPILPEAFATAIRMAKELEMQAGLGPIANAHLGKRVKGCEEALAQRDDLIAELRAQIEALLAEKLTPEVFTCVADWLKDPQRKPASTAFTSGMERQIAYALELDVLPHVKSMEMRLARAVPPNVPQPDNRQQTTDN